MSERVLSVWHIEQRFGDRYYVVNQWGGFSLWHKTLEAAEAQARAYEAEGDVWQQ